MSRNETHEEAEARYASWADAAERGEFHSTGEFWINPDHPDCRPGRPKSGERRPSSMVSVRLNEAYEERLDQFLAKTGQARSDVLRTALDEYLTRHRAWHSQPCRVLSVAADLVDPVAAQLPT